jgi:hypothetical protein
MKGDSATLALREGVNGAIHMVAKFDPPVSPQEQEDVMDDNFDDVRPIVVALLAAQGAVGNYLAGLVNADGTTFTRDG